MKLYEKFYNNNQCDSFSIFLLFPGFSFKRETREGMILEVQKTTEIDLSTYICYTTQEDFWSFKMRLLGFGICINRQTGY